MSRRVVVGIAGVFVAGLCSAPALAQEVATEAPGAVEVTPGPATEDLAADDKSFWEIIGEDDPNPTTYEFSFATAGISQTWGLTRWSGGGLYFGAGGDIGAPVYRLSKFDDRSLTIDKNLDILAGRAFLRLRPFPYVELDGGMRIALGATLADVDAQVPRGNFAVAGYGDLMIGSSKIKVGGRFEYARLQYDKFTQAGYRITPLMLRVQL